MYSWSGIGVPTTKAIIRESARLVNLTLGRAGFFMLRRLLRGGRPLEQVGRLPRSAYHAIQKSRDGVVFAIANLHPSQPLTSGFFGLFRLRRRNKKLTFPVPSSPLRVINPFKTLQKPLEAILKPSKGFSLSATHPKSENAVKGQYADRLRSGNP